MPANVNASGSQACTIGTEHTLATVATPLTLHLEVEIPAAATFADVFEFSVVDKLAASGDTAQRAGTVTIRGRGVAFHTHPLNPILSPVSSAFTVKQTDGTARTVLWAVKAA